MKLTREESGVNPRTLQIGGEGVKLASRVGQVAFVEFGNHDATTFDADFQAIKGGGRASKTVVGLIQAVQDARVGRIVEPVGAKMKVKSTERLGHLEEERVFLSVTIAIGREGGLSGTRLR